MAETGSTPPEPPSRYERAMLPLNNLIVRFSANGGPLEPAAAAAMIAAGQVGLQLVGPCLQWVGAGLSLAVTAVKSHLAAAVITEFVAAKTLDFQLTKRLRAPDAKARKLYRAMARAGLESGWKNDGMAIPWWFGAISYGATGSMDFLVGQALGQQIRSVFDLHPAVCKLLKEGGLSEADLEALKTEFFERSTAALAKNLRVPDRELKSPLTRHLLAALTNKYDDKMLHTVERRICTNDPGDAAFGTMAGHGAAGAVVGAMLGNPTLGLLVGLADATGDAVLTKAALSGHFQTLAKMKAQLLKEGWDKEEDIGVSGMLADFYAPIGAEFRDLGTDLRDLSETNAHALGETLAPMQQMHEWLSQRLGNDSPTTGPVEYFGLDELIRKAAGLVSDGLARHAELPISDVLASDFPGAVEKLKSSRKHLKGVLLVALLHGEEASIPKRLRTHPLERHTKS